jgi:hypothetical protein
MRYCSGAMTLIGNVPGPEPTRMFAGLLRVSGLTRCPCRHRRFAPDP